MRRSKLAQLGERPLKALGGGFAAITMFTEVLARAGAGELIVAAIFQLAAFGVLVSVIAWHRDDDLVEAGVLLALITGIAFGASRVLTSMLDTRSLAGILMIPGMMVGLLVRAVVGGVIGAIVIWFLRLVRPPTRLPSA